MQGFNLRLKRIRNHPITKLLQTSNISTLSAFWWFQSTWTWMHFALAYAALIWKQLPGSSISIAIALKAVAFPAQGPMKNIRIFSFRYCRKVTSMMLQHCLILEHWIRKQYVQALQLSLLLFKMLLYFAKFTYYWILHNLSCNFRETKTWAESVFNKNKMHWCG